MKRLKYPLGLAVCLLVSAAVPIAHGTTDSSMNTISRLTAVEKKVATLQKQMKTLQGLASCVTFGVAAVTAYGDQTNGTNGYVYQDNAKAPPQYLVTGLDFTENGGGDPDVLVPALNPQCVSTYRAPAGHGVRRVSPQAVHLLHFRLPR
jgi:hypothetical protein